MAKAQRFNNKLVRCGNAITTACTCAGWSPCPECAESITTGCVGTIPRYIKITVSKVRKCSDDTLWDATINGSFVVECATPGLVDYPFWTVDAGAVRITFYFEGTVARIILINLFNFKEYFFGTIPAGNWCDCSGTVSNDIVIGDCGGGVLHLGYDGSATWEPTDALGDPCGGCDMSIPTICDLDTSDDLDVTFNDLDDCGIGGNCVGNDCESNFNGNTFRISWDAARSAWYGQFAVGGGDINVVWVSRNCAGAGTLSVGAIHARFGDNNDCCFEADDVPLTGLPQTVNNDHGIGDCTDVGCIGADTYICGHNGTALIEKVP